MAMRPRGLYGLLVRRHGRESHAAVLRTPRAIDSMLVTLEKIPLSAQDRQALASFTDGRVRNQALSQAPP